MTSGDLSSLAPAIRALCNLLKSSRTPAIIIAGVAASLQGQARATEDVDALVRLDERIQDLGRGMLRQTVSGPTVGA
jgi:hypothetical protein